MSETIEEQRQFRVSLAQMVFAEIQVEATSPEQARELALQRIAGATVRFATTYYPHRTEIITRVVDGVPVWTEVS